MKIFRKRLSRVLSLFLIAFNGSEYCWNSLLGRCLD